MLRAIFFEAGWAVRGWGEGFAPEAAGEGVEAKDLPLEAWGEGVGAKDLPLEGGGEGVGAKDSPSR